MHCGKYFEIWNDVFMQYKKTSDGSYEKLERTCVDTGMGIERTIAMLQHKGSVYETELFAPVIRMIEGLSGASYGTDESSDISIRIIADHIRTSVFILGDEQSVSPSNLGQGYILRRLIRRAVRHGKKLGIEGAFLSSLVDTVIDQYQQAYPMLLEKVSEIKEELQAEEDRFSTLC